MVKTLEDKKKEILENTKKSKAYIVQLETKLNEAYALIEKLKKEKEELETTLDTYLDELDTEIDDVSRHDDKLKE